MISIVNNDGRNQFNAGYAPWQDNSEWGTPQQK